MPCDFSLGHAPGRQAGPAAAARSPPATATRLPFADDTFDAVTISFGLRNIVDPDAGLREMLRVTRPGGRLVVCEFSHPTWAPFRTVYVEYLMRALPSVARAVSSSPDAYVYLAESIRAWPDQQRLAARIAAAGWTGAPLAQPLRRHRRPAPRRPRAGVNSATRSMTCSRRSGPGTRAVATLRGAGSQHVTQRL